MCHTGPGAGALRQALHENQNTLLLPPSLEYLFKQVGGPAPALL